MMISSSEEKSLPQKLSEDIILFSAFNVQYVPFGVLVDSRNRALWMGNSLQLTPEIIEKSSK